MKAYCQEKIANLAIFLLEGLQAGEGIGAKKQKRS
jgi:hypothetical protein